MLQSKTLRNERMRSSRIKQNRGMYCVDRERTEYDIRCILCLLLGHMVQVAFPVIVIGVEIVTLGRGIVSVAVWLRCRVSWLRALFSIVSLFSTCVAGNTRTIGEILVPCMKILIWTSVIGRGSACPI